MSVTNEELVGRIQDGEAVSENLAILYEQNMGFIKKIARKFSHIDQEDDLLQEGFFGLYQAVKKYDIRHEVKFLTYAEHWIKQSMARYSESAARNVRIPANLQWNVYQYNAIIKEYKREFNRKPHSFELKKRLGVSGEQLTRIKEAACSLREVSLNAILGGKDGDLTLEDTIESPENIEDAVIDSIYTEKLKKDVWEFVGQACDQEEQEVIELKYCRNATLKCISESMGNTVNRVRQTEDRALKKLRSGPGSRNFRMKYENEICKAYRSNLTSFKISGTSSTERVAIELYELDGGAGLEA